MQKALNDGKITKSDRDAVKHYIVQRQEAGLRYIQEVSARIRPTSLEKAPPDTNQLTSDSAPVDPDHEFSEILQQVQSHLQKKAQAFDLRFETVGKCFAATDCLRGELKLTITPLALGIESQAVLVPESVSDRYGEVKWREDSAHLLANVGKQEKLGQGLFNFCEAVVDLWPTYIQLTEGIHRSHESIVSYERQQVHDESSKSQIAVKPAVGKQASRVTTATKATPKNPAGRCYVALPNRYHMTVIVQECGRKSRAKFLADKLKALREAGSALANDSRYLKDPPAWEAVGVTQKNGKPVRTPLAPKFVLLVSGRKAVVYACEALALDRVLYFKIAKASLRSPRTQSMDLGADIFFVTALIFRTVLPWAWSIPSRCFAPSQSTTTNPAPTPGTIDQDEDGASSVASQADLGYDKQDILDEAKDASLPPLVGHFKRFFALNERIWNSSISQVWRAVRKADHAAVILKYCEADALVRTARAHTLLVAARDCGRDSQQERQSWVAVVPLLDIEWDSYRQTGVVITPELQSVKEVMSAIAPAAAGLPRRMDADSAAWFFTLSIQLAECVGVLHAADIAHGDIKPSNVMWDPVTQHVCLIDLGCSEHPMSKTMLSVHSGTWVWMHPDRFSDDEILEPALSADMYGLAAVIVHALRSAAGLVCFTKDPHSAYNHEILPPMRRQLIQIYGSQVWITDLMAVLRPLLMDSVGRDNRRITKLMTAQQLAAAMRRVHAAFVCSGIADTVRLLSLFVHVVKALLDLQIWRVQRWFAIKSRSVLQIQSTVTMVSVFSWASFAHAQYLFCVLRARCATLSHH